MNFDTKRDLYESTKNKNMLNLQSLSVFVAPEESISPVSQGHFCSTVEILMIYFDYFFWFFF